MTENQYKGRKRAILSMSSCKQIDDFSDCISKRCSRCKGGCCKNFPCTLSPLEFLDIEDIDYMKSILDTGILTIAPGNTDKKYYIIRPRGKNDSDYIVSDIVASPNECLLRGKKGCLLDPLTRPTEGLLTMPREKSKLCECYYSEMKIMDDWIRREEAVKKLVELYKTVLVPKYMVTSETVKTYRLRLIGVDRKETN
jgi:hypothetical protein